MYFYRRIYLSDLVGSTTGIIFGMLSSFSNAHWLDEPTAIAIAILLIHSVVVIARSPHSYSLKQK